MDIYQRQEVGPHGFIQLTDFMGGDISIVNAARQSFDQSSHTHQQLCPQIETDEDCDCKGGVLLSKRDRGLINFLMRKRHGSPFEQVEFQFAARAPIFVIREWVRHRIAEINEESGRYSQLQRQFWYPSPEDVRTQVGTPGNYTYEPLEDYQHVIDSLKFQNESAFDTYERMLAMGVAKEVARTCLPVATYSSFVWKCNLRSMMNFLSLRNHDEAQKEIRSYAEVMELIIQEIVPVTMSAFNQHDRRTP